VTLKQLILKVNHGGKGDDGALDLAGYIENDGNPKEESKADKNH